MPTPPEWSPDFVPATAKAFTYEEDPPTPVWMDPRSLAPIIITEHDPLTCSYCQFFAQDTMAKDAEACADDCECRQFDHTIGTETEDYACQCNECLSAEIILYTTPAVSLDAPFWTPGNFPGDTPKYFEDAFSRIFDQAYDLLVEKQEAYGPENVRELGFYGVFSRLASDKVNRLRNLMNGTLENGKISIDWADTNDESVEDTLLDIANYALILVALQRGWWGLPLADAEIPFS
jgi:hypothetical protein